MMKYLVNLFRSMALTLAFAVAVTLTSVSAMAGEATLKLKDGRTLTGEVTKELDGYIWLKYKIGDMVKNDMFGPGEIEKITRDDAAATETPKPAAPSTDEPGAIVPAVPNVGEPEKGWVKRPGVPRAAVITLGEGGEKNMVGQFMTAHILRQAIPKLKEDGVEVVVLLINSGGGALLEIQRLSDVIHDEMKKEFRVVAWIHSAISAAAMTAHCLDEIYFMPEGNYGACTAFSGDLVAMKGFGLEGVLQQMERISARGNHDPKIMRSMQITVPLSATIDPNGDVTWYQDETSGKEIVNREGKILTFDAATALRFKFSKGTAASVDELGRAMGFKEVDWVGKKKPGIPYPVCRGEELQIAYRDQVFVDSRKTTQYRTDYNAYIQDAQAAQDRETRGKFAAKATEALNKIVRMVKNNPNFMIFMFNMEEQEFKEWVDEQRRLLRKIASGTGR